MDFKSFVNKENFKAILFRHLKHQVQTKFNSSVTDKINSNLNNEAILSENMIDSISSSILQSNDFTNFSREFLQSVNELFEDQNQYISKEENQGCSSQCSSASSVNSSIDYLSFDQFQILIDVLSNGVNAEKLEAIESFSRLPSLDHLIRKSLWPALENGLHEALFSKVLFLREAAFKLYMKMLSSSEPKVVQESFSSLNKLLLQNVFLNISQNVEDLSSKCSGIVQVIAIINKFLQNISNHWMRYPQNVIEDITHQSVSLLSFASNSSPVFPVWLCIALCDKKSKWLKNILYGQVSRKFLISFLHEDKHVLEFVVNYCKKFIQNAEVTKWDKQCCQKVSEIAEVTHIICFMCHLLRYSQGRELFNFTSQNTDILSWLSTLNLTINCVERLCNVCCFTCCISVCEVMTQNWTYVWNSAAIKKVGDYLIKMIFDISLENSSVNCVNFILLCLSDVFENIILYCFKECEKHFINYICLLLKYLTNLNYDFENGSSILSLFNSSLKLMIKAFSVPSYLFTNLTFIKTFNNWYIKVITVFSTLRSNIKTKSYKTIIPEIENNIAHLLISVFQKPFDIKAPQNCELIEMSINTLLEKILKSNVDKNFICSKDTSILSNALGSVNSKAVLMNKTMILKLSSVIWQLDINDDENLTSLQCILEAIIPSLHPEIFNTEITLNHNTPNDIKLFQYVLLFPSLTREDFIFFEDYNVIALRVLSLLANSFLSSCLLQDKFKLADILFQIQEEHFKNNGNYIIDPISVLQNHLLVKMHVIGGFNEKNLPPDNLSMFLKECSWTFFSSYPVPDLYYSTLPITEVNFDLIKLFDTENIQTTYLQYIKKYKYSSDNEFQLLKHSMHLLGNVPYLSKSLNFITLEDASQLTLQNETLVGLDMTVRYGCILNQMVVDDTANLKLLLKAGKCLLNAENRPQIDPFVCSVYFISKCNIEIAWPFLETFAKSSNSLFIWHERVIQDLENNEKIFTITNVIMEYCDIIVKKTLPKIYSSFQFSGLLPSVLFKYYTTLCYWNYLNFTEISLYVLLSVVFSGDFCIYFFASVLKHLQNVILQNAHHPNILSILKNSPIKNFKLCNYIHFILELSNEFNSTITKCIESILKE